MKELVQAELLKLRTTRTIVGLFLATLAMVTLTAAVSVPEIGVRNPLVPLDDPRLLAQVVGNSFGVPLVLMLLLGGVAFTQEVRYGTITSTYLVEPRRSRILAAKWLTMALVGLIVTAATLVVSVAFSVVLIRARGGEAQLGALFWQMAAAGAVVMATYGVIGVALGALLRNQITAVVVVLVWMLVVEQIVVNAYPSVGRWMPGATAYVLMQLGPSVDPDGRLLPASASGVVLAAYAAVAVVLALRLTPARDVA